MKTLELLEKIENTEHIIRQINAGVTGDDIMDNGYQRMFDDDFNEMQENKIVLFDSLGTTAKLMLEIGIIKDVLINEFKFKDSLAISRLIKHNKNIIFSVDFLTDFVCFTLFDMNNSINNISKNFSYKDQNWKCFLLDTVNIYSIYSLNCELK